jgi:hypothetical protein
MTAQAPFVLKKRRPNKQRDDQRPAGKKDCAGQKEAGVKSGDQAIKKPALANQSGFSKSGDETMTPCFAGLATTYSPVP